MPGAPSWRVGSVDDASAGEKSAPACIALSRCPRPASGTL